MNGGQSIEINQHKIICLLPNEGNGKWENNNGKKGKRKEDGTREQ